MIPPGCEARCRGCSHREFSREESLAQKRDFVARLFPGVGVEAVRSRGEDGRLGYREKTVLHAERGEEAWKLGLLIPAPARKERVEILPIPGCPVHSARLNRGAALVARSFPGEVPLRFVVASGRQLTVVLKCAEGAVSDAGLAGWAASFARALPGEWDGVWACFHPAAGRRVLSAKGWRLLWGEGVSGPEGRRYGPSSFQQLLPDLYDEATEMARAHLWGSSAIVDFCAGTGETLARWDAPALGVELSGEATEVARANAPSAEILRGKCSERLPQVSAWVGGRAGPIGVFCNPPRPGMESEVIAWISSEPRVKRVAYLSCSPATLARDAELLGRAGFRAKRIAPFDFFPRTHHVETLALFERD